MYIDCVYVYNGVYIKVNDALKEEVLFNFKNMLKMKEQMLEELYISIR